MTQKERKTAKELEDLALEIARRMQGCAGIASVTVSPNEYLGWIIRAWERGTARAADATVAVAVTQIDLQRKYDLLEDG
jgi:hypothetical protein